jgi:hypothetical protein
MTAMKLSLSCFGTSLRPRLYFSITVSIALILFSAAVNLAPATRASGDDCSAATVINPALLPFVENSTTAGAANDIDPGPGGCAPGLGADVVYSFTPAATDTYTIGATPSGAGFDLSLYVVTDCANPAGTCVAGANAQGFGKGEFITPVLTGGTKYFIVVDGASQEGGGDFRISVRRGVVTNDDCSGPAIIDPGMLPLTLSGTTFGADNDLNPGVPCLRSNQSGSGRDVVYLFTPADSQNYVVTVTPLGNYDATVYIVTGCEGLAACTSSDLGGNGEAESLRRNLTAGTSYFIVVDGFQGDAGDFTLMIEPTIPIAPAAPSELVAVAVSDARIDLTWEDNANNESGFRIERSLNGFDFTEIASVGPNVTSFSDLTVFASTAFFYRVFSFNNFGNAVSNVAGVTTPAPPPPPVPVITAAPNPMAFGTVNSATAVTQNLTVGNAGGAALVVTAISDPSGAFSIVNKPALPVTIQPGQGTQLTVRFAPMAAQNFAGSFTIQSNDPAAPVLTVNLSGTGTGTPVSNLQLTTTLLDFAGGESSSAIEVMNTGNADLVISSIALPAAPFFVTGFPGLPAVVRPGEGFVLNVAFTPAGAGVFSGTITIVTNDPDQLITAVHLRGTSTPTNEQLKLKAPALVAAVAGSTITLNVLAANGTNSDITLSATPVAGGTFTDRGNGRGDLIFTSAPAATGDRLVTFTARDSAGRLKTLQGVITILPQASTHSVLISWTPPVFNTPPNAPSNAVALDLSIPPIPASAELAGSPSVEPAQQTGLVGYVVYRSTAPGVPESLSNIVGVVPATQTSFTDTAPAPASSPQVFFYSVTALYATGAESAPAAETSSGPRMAGLQFRSKGIRFQADSSNVAAGAVLVVDGQQTFALELSGGLFIVHKNARSTPGNLRPRDIFRGNSTHTVQVRNPDGAASAIQNLSR